MADPLIQGGQGATQSAPQGATPDASPAAQRLLTVKNFYRAFSSADLRDLTRDLERIYHRDVVFTDPAGEIRGRDNLRRHYERLLAAASHCSFEFMDEQEVVRPRTQGKGDAAVLCWRMTLAAAPLAGGRRFQVEGISHLQFADNAEEGAKESTEESAAGLIIAHRDYFDLGAMLYEQLPLLGAICRRLRRRLALQH